LKSLKNILAENNKHREMLEIFSHAICPQYFLDESFPGDYSGSFGYPPLIAILGLNLTDPAGIPIRGRADENLRMQRAEIEGLQVGFGVGRHEFSVDEKRRSCRRINFGF
jgi:hypothetical protein